MDSLVLFRDRLKIEESNIKDSSNASIKLYRLFSYGRFILKTTELGSSKHLYNEVKKFVKEFDGKINKKNYSDFLIKIFELLKFSLEEFKQIDKWNRFAKSSIFITNNYKMAVHELNNSRKSLTIYSPFNNDLSRIITSSSFRRLQDKAQVFSLETYDFVRTRLTHSLEVSDISEQLAYKIFSNSLNARNNLAVIVRCASLLHDLGNPPFGHYGETIIRNVCFDLFNDKKYEMKIDILSEKVKGKTINEIIDNEQMLNDFYYFDGNAQTFRIINNLQTYNSQLSLNLTGSVLRSIIKYPFNSVETKERGKFGYFYSEKHIVDFLVNKCQFKTGKVYLPAMIMECADDIGYMISDIEDSFKKELIKYEDIDTFDYKKECTEVKNFIENFRKFYKLNKKINSDPLETTLQRLLNTLKIHLISETAFLIANDAYLTRHLNRNISFYHYVEKTSSYKVINFFRKNFIKPNVFNGRLISSDELEADKILSYLLREFIQSILCTDFIIDKNNQLSFKSINGCDKYQKLLYLISPHLKIAYISAKRETVKEELYFRLKMIVDYISGMTDSYAKRLYNKLNGTK